MPVVLTAVDQQEFILDVDREVRRVCDSKFYFTAHLQIWIRRWAVK
jgi:hypothetical protein